MSEYTTTPNLGLYKPNILADGDQWGNHWNSNADKLDTALGSSAAGPFLPLSGGTVTGSVTIGSAQPNALAFSGGSGQATIAGTGTNGGINLWPTGNGQVNLGMNHNYTGTAQSGVYINYTGLGTITDNSTPYNILTVVTESINAAGAQGGGLSNIRNAINLQAGAVGGRTAFGIDFHQVGATNSNGVGQYYVALSAYATASYSAGGTSGTPMGILFGAVDSARLDTGATFWDGVCGYELDVGAQTGTSVAYKQGMKIVLWGSDAVAGTQGADFCFSMNAMTGFVGPGWDVGYCFGSPDGVWAIKTTGTLIGTVPTAQGGRAYTAQHGVDFSAVTFSQDAFKSNGFRVDGYGDIVSNQIQVGGGAGPAWIAATGAPASTQPIGSLYSRTDGVLGTTFYVSLGGGSWTSYLPAAGGTLTGGLHFGSVTVGSTTDLSRHVDLYGGVAGLSVTSGPTINYNAGVGGHVFFVNAANVGYIGTDGINNMAVGNSYLAPGSFTQVKIGTTAGPTWTTGAAAPAATAPIGSLYSRTGGAVGATLYVSRGGGTWAAVAGV